jgi:hypothetical protein
VTAGLVTRDTADVPTKRDVNSSKTFKDGVLYTVRGRFVKGGQKRPKGRIFIRNKPNFSSDRLLHKDYYLKSSVEK